MKIGFIGFICLGIFVFAESISAGPFFDDDEEAFTSDIDYSDNTLENLMHAVQQKRACVRRNGNCDHRPNDCCFSSSCRCNLWGSNCRCQRVGLFQKWG
ncbi:PREDICTED: U8-agatoxin-Ao1a-like isoform X2 [Ceratosolen solmsi marchali]|uniref:U8-agatoxin-Ao1a-like isoform X2 n=1 Tax=Ceratosolen solmsi marchali TaxID=326594 RepID=A0AAJ7E0D3_9HYME|nr:PREDICTED: U8-agatoxin-Ao1a-like isoform X2 [Ceratosolen solmsi marchali]